MPAVSFLKPHDTKVILKPVTGAVVRGDSWYGNEGKKRP
jgi:hypothetical protein